MSKVVLAFSGGLDTTYCAMWLQKDQGHQVHTVLVDTGGFSPEELQATERRAAELGVASHTTLTVAEEYYQETLRYLLFGNVLRGGVYPLSVSAERMVQARKTVEHALALGADAIAHGSTGAGNDQVRFDIVAQVLAPHMQVITPIRDQQLSRQQEVDYLAANGLKLDWTQAKYSINQGLWGTSVGGSETLTSHLPLPEEAWPQQLTQDGEERITLGFTQGEPSSLSGKEMPPVELIAELNALGGSFAIGRDVHVGDTIIGLKGRVGFEAPGALMLIKAHQLLEKHTLSKWQQHWKDQIGQFYGTLLHEGAFLDPVMKDFEALLANSQSSVSGEVYLSLKPYRFELLGCESPHDALQASGGSYGEAQGAWTGVDVRGFTTIYANAYRILHQSQKGS